MNPNWPYVEQILCLKHLVDSSYVSSAFWNETKSFIRNFLDSYVPSEETKAEIWEWIYG